jgi:hypothetical protein
MWVAVRALIGPAAADVGTVPDANVGVGTLASLDASTPPHAVATTTTEDVGVAGRDIPQSELPTVRTIDHPGVAAAGSCDRCSASPTVTHAVGPAPSLTWLMPAGTPGTGFQVLPPSVERSSDPPDRSA